MLSGPVEELLARCGAGELPAGVALGRLLPEFRALSTLRDALDRHALGAGPAAAGARELRAALDANRAGVEDALAILAGAPDDPAALAGTVDEGLDRVRRLFDGAVRVNPAASVAVYSLGSEALLAAATAEVADLARALGVARPGRAVLDIGCGIGRLELALAARVGSITGVDVSPAMVETARARCAGLANVALLATDGRDLRAFADAAFDAAVAVDSFPYLYQAGGPAFALALLREVARVLRPGGDALVLNLSYRGDPGLDRADAAAFASELGLDLPRNGTADLRSWNGLTFHFRRPGAA